MYDKSFTDLLFKAPANAVYAFVNEKDKRIYITYCTSFLSSVDRTIQLIERSKNSNRLLYDDRNKLDLIVLATDLVDKNSMRLMTSYWSNHYRNIGYSLYRKYNHIEYKIRTVINKSYQIEVQLVTRNNATLVVGVFSKAEEANEFTNECLVKQGSCILPVYALNQLTKEYFIKQ
jgi:hypothetical protein